MSLKDHPMTELLKRAVHCHGGLARWEQLNTLAASMSITGAIWAPKGQPDALVDIRVEAQLHTEHVVIHQLPRRKKFIFTPQRITQETESGEPLGARDNPRESFKGQTQLSPWDDLHLGYFCGYALWTYLTVPFLYTRPGFGTEEIAPWDEDGERWRVLQVTFPRVCREPLVRAIVVLRPRRPPASARVHGRRDGRGSWRQLCFGLPRSRWDTGSNQAPDLCV